MRRPNSLRFRILVSFVVAGAVLGPLLAAVLLTLSYYFEELAVEREVQAQLQQVLETPERFLLRELPGVPKVQVLASLSLDTLPTGMLHQPDGVHEYETAGGTWYVGLATTEHGRYAVVEDISILEHRERLAVYVLLSALPLGMYFSLWLGYYLSRRLVAPITALAAEVSEEGDALSGAPRATDWVDDEVNELAMALDRYRQRMQAALRREREFSADVSHELRNPLAVIQGAVELIADDPGLSARGKRALARIAKATERMRDTVSTLLVMAREQEIGPSLEDVSVADCVAAQLVQLDPGAGPEVEWQSSARPVVRAPRVAVEVIIGNLIRNALQHSQGSRVQVLLQQDRLTVRDDGVGIPPHELERVAERRNHSSGESNGIGLSLVRRLCERYGWTLSIDSRVGGGTVVHWRFDPA